LQGLTSGYDPQIFSSLTGSETPSNTMRHCMNPASVGYLPIIGSKSVQQFEQGA